MGLPLKHQLVDWFGSDAPICQGLSANFQSHRSHPQVVHSEFRLQYNCEASVDLGWVGAESVWESVVMMLRGWTFREDGWILDYKTLLDSGDKQQKMEQSQMNQGAAFYVRR